MSAVSLERETVAASTADAICGIVVRAVNYRRVDPPFPCASPGREQGATELARFLAASVAPSLAKYGCDAFVVISTITLPRVMDRHDMGALFEQEVRARLGRGFDFMVNAYECAGWGYMLRYFADRPSRGRLRLMMAIMDIDIHGLSIWKFNRRWGDSGFGIATVVVDYDPERAQLRIGHAPPQSAITQMAREVRSLASEWPDAQIALPFYIAETSDMLRRTVNLPERVLDDIHAEYGHSFGADPWILAARSYAAAGGACRNAILASQSLNGYYCVARVAFDPQAEINIDCGQHAAARTSP